MGISTPVEFNCFMQQESFESSNVTIFYDDMYFDVRADECPYCDETHWTTI